MLVLSLSRSQLAARVGIAAAVALAVWLLVLVALAALSRSRRPDPAPASMELGGQEPPAVVSMLVGGWRVGREAVPATLLDLAARKVLDIEAVGPERFVCRLRRSTSSAPGLTSYEHQVLDHVRRLAAADGTVVCEALTTGPEGRSNTWWKAFEAAVVKDARDRGLSRGRWSRWMLVVLAVTALAPAILAALALVVLPPQQGGKDDNPIGAFLGLTTMVEFALLAVPTKLRAERDTPEGAAAAARWLGLREYLSEDGAFSDAPPAAVAIWDRYMSYGAAMGVAGAAVRALPLGSESDTVAWSHFGGRWRMVRVDYPRRVPPGWGRHPALASLIGVVSLAAGLLAARIFLSPVLDNASRLLEGTRDEGFRPFDLLGVALLGIPTAVTVVWLIRSVIMLSAAVPDLFVRQEIAGMVLRIRPHDKQPYLAVDDGTRTEIRAWLVEPAMLHAAGLSQGDPVRATVSPRLGHVFSLTPATSGPAGV